MALPVEVTSPVKLALVTTVVAFPTEVTIPVKLALVAFAVVTADVTNSVVATWVVFVDAAAVGAKGVPVKVGETDNTKLPVPVSSEITPANSAEVVAAITFNLSVVTTNVFEVGIVVLLILVAVATPKTGVTKVGEVALTTSPDPVVAISSITPAPELTLPNTLSVALTF